MIPTSAKHERRSNAAAVMTIAMTCAGISERHAEFYPFKIQNRLMDDFAIGKSVLIISTIGGQTALVGLCQVAKGRATFLDSVTPLMICRLDGEDGLPEPPVV